MPCHAPRKEEPPLTDDRFDALALCHLEDLRVREGGMVSTKSVLKGPVSQQDVVVSRSKLDKVFRPEVPRRTLVQPGLNHLGLQAFGLSG